MVGVIAYGVPSMHDFCSILLQFQWLRVLLERWSMTIPNIQDD